MSAQPVTYEQMMAMFLETREQIKATNEAVERTNEAVGSLSNRVGEMVEKLVGEGNLVDQFRELGTVDTNFS